MSPLTADQIQTTDDGAPVAGAPAHGLQQHRYVVSGGQGLPARPTDVSIVGKVLPFGDIDGFACAHARDIRAFPGVDACANVFHMQSLHAEGGAFTVVAKPHDPENREPATGLRIVPFEGEQIRNSNVEEILFEDGRKVDVDDLIRLTTYDHGNLPWSLGKHVDAYAILLYLGCLDAGATPADAISIAYCAKWILMKEMRLLDGFQEWMHRYEFTKNLRTLGLCVQRPGEKVMTRGPLADPLAGMASTAALEEARRFGVASASSQNLFTAIIAAFSDPASLLLLGQTTASAHERLEAHEAMARLKQPLQRFRKSAKAVAGNANDDFLKAIKLRLPEEPGQWRID